MKKEDVVLLAQLIQTIKEATDKLEEYQKKKNVERFNAAKKEILELQKRVNELL